MKFCANAACGKRLNCGNKSGYCSKCSKNFRCHSCGKCSSAGWRCAECTARLGNLVGKKSSTRKAHAIARNAEMVKKYEARAAAGLPLFE